MGNPGQEEEASVCEGNLSGREVAGIPRTAVMTDIWWNSQLRTTRTRCQEQTM
jgi:hypothetical protein